LRTCASISQNALGFSESAILEFEIYKIKAACNLDAICCAPMGATVIVRYLQNPTQYGHREARLVAKADALCRPRFATGPEQ
jgi:hypothetical protein